MEITSEESHLPPAWVKGDEVGYLNPELIEDYYGQFLDLLDSPDNRLVWGAMLALSLIAYGTPMRFTLIWEKY